MTLGYDATLCFDSLSTTNAKLIGKQNYFIKTIYFVIIQYDIQIYQQKSEQLSFHSSAGDAEFLNRKMHNCIYSILLVFKTESLF